MDEMMEQVLEQVREQGRFDSQDHFRLDPKVAMRKLRESLYGDPHRALLKAVQAATVLKCEELRLRPGTELLVEFPGGLSFAYPITDPYQLFLPGQARLENHLALMLSGFLALTNSFLEMPFQDPRGAFVLKANRSGLSLGPTERGGPVRVGLPSRDQQLMMDRLRQCPLSSLRLGPSVSLPDPFPATAAMAQVEGDPAWGELTLRNFPPGAVVYRLSEQIGPATPRPAQALIAYGLGRSPGLLHLVQDGVVVESLHETLAPGQIAYLSVSDLPTDLGGFQVLREPLQPRIDQVRQAFRKLRDQMAQDFLRLPRRWAVAAAYLTSVYRQQHL